MTSLLNTLAPSPATRNAGSRLYWLDMLRVVAMVDIVSTHTTDVHLLGGIGLPILLLTATAFGTIRSRKLTTRQVLGRRAKRLLLPWLSWCVVYAIAFVLFAYRHGEPIFGWAKPLMVLYGPAIHLWFVTFAFLSAPIIAAITRILQNVPVQWSFYAATCVGVVVLLATSALRLQLNVPAPFPQWVFSLGAIPLGIALGLAIGDHDSPRRSRLLLTLVCTGIILAIVGMEFLPSAPWPHEKWLIRRFAYALALLATAAIWQGRVLPGADLIVTATLGVYLVHPLVRLVLTEANCYPAAPWLQIVIVYVLSLMIAVALLRSRLRWAV